MALARLGSGDEAVEMFHMLNPINHTRTAADVERYSGGALRGRGRRLRAPAARRPRRLDLVHRLRRLDVPRGPDILGLQRRGNVFSMDPCVPSSWPGFEIRWRFGSTLYAITVENHGQRGRDAVTATLDGQAVDRRAIPLKDDGQQHDVRIVLGRPGDARPETVGVQTTSR